MPTGASFQRPANNEPQRARSDAPPSKRDLTTWWRQFKKNSKRDEEKVEVAQQTGIFGVPLEVSIKYANVAISLINNDGQNYIYGYVPIVVAKCGVYLKEKATEVEGIFRLAGAERRIKELMVVFNSPDRYGKGLDWTGYTVHDAANLLRRYLNQLPDPMIPMETYYKFRTPLMGHQAQAVGERDGQKPSTGEFDVQATIQTYQRLITELPPLNRQLLLYILDLLAVFSAKSDVNRMDASNLSSIFQPGILRHPDTDLAPEEYRLSQDVLIFLIVNQDHFIVGMEGTAADEKTIQDVQSAAKPSPSPSTPKVGNQQLIGRSTSSASAQSESRRRFGDIRRNASTNSRGSRQSNYSPSPVTPPAASPFTPGSKGSGVYRSNTLPSKKSPSPALSAIERFQPFRGAEPAAAANPLTATPAASSPLSAAQGTVQAGNQSDRLQAQQGGVGSPKASPAPSRSPLLRPFVISGRRSTSQDRQLTPGDAMAVEMSSGSGRVSPSGTPTRERGLTSLFKQSPSSDTESRSGRRPKKLQKKRIGDTLNPHDSQQSLSGGSHPSSPSFPPSSVGEDLTLEGGNQQSELPTRPNIPIIDSPQTTNDQSSEAVADAGPGVIARDNSSTTLKPESVVQDTVPRKSSTTVRQVQRSDTESMTSHDTGNEASSLDTGDEGEEAGGKKHHRWRISMSSKRPEVNQGHLAASTLGSSEVAERSASSVASGPTKSFTEDSNRSSSARAQSSSEVDEQRATSPRRNPVKWFKEKLQERQEKRDDRAKSPSRQTPEEASSQSLDAVAAGESEPIAETKTTAPAAVPGAPTLATNQPAQPIRLSTENLRPAEDSADTSEAVTPRAPQQFMQTDAVAGALSSESQELATGPKGPEP